MSLMLENQIYRLEEKIKDLEERLSFLEAHVVVGTVPDKSPEAAKATSGDKSGKR